MAVSVPRSVVEEMLLGPPDDRRQLQDSPVLGDVWIAFAAEPARSRDLLITPHKAHTASEVAVAIADRLERDGDDDPEIASLHGIVAARLYFPEILRVVVPMTGWWSSQRTRAHLDAYLDPQTGRETLGTVMAAALDVVQPQEGRPRRRSAHRLSALDRYVALAALLLWAGESRSGDPFEQALGALDAGTLTGHLVRLFDSIATHEAIDGLVFQVSLNRAASPAILRSVPAVKGDAARTLFSVSCKDVTWAVIDSGIDDRHPAFQDDKARSRVRRSFDFTQFRRIVSLSNARPAIRRRNLERLNDGRATRKLAREEADAGLAQLADDARAGRPINWLLVERFITLDPGEPPPSDHGTHVAGIIGASKAPQLAAGLPADDCADGMCPDINLFDLRVLAPTLEETEFAVIAAMQYIRHLNERHRFITVHGANLSLSIPHDVRNFACGRTPVCLEAEQLVENGIVAVAAAGNLGYHSFQTATGSYEGYAAFSITDPGNADGVITVGSTHRFSPHTYGVSFFSSRGPTGDGRPKPDLVAPGERIRSPLPGPVLGDLDGTSMAAPHVSGAAAMLMARYSELIGQPRRIKQIILDSATDLGRERAFQGRGMLDILRAFQSI